MRHTVVVVRDGVGGTVLRLAYRGSDGQTAQAARLSREPTGRSARLLCKRMKQLEDRIEVLHERLAALESRLRLSAHDMCPQCRSGRLRVTETAPHPEFGFAGIETHQVRCDRADCGYAATRLYDPNEFLR